MKHPDIHRLEELLKRHPAPAPRLFRPAEPHPSPGQIWTLAKSSLGDIFHEVMVLAHPNKEDGLETVNVAPLVHDATTAGPKDYILPENILCHHAAILLGMDFSLPTSNLGNCQEALKAPLLQEVLTHYAKSQDRTLTPSECHAPAFFDTRDFRYRFQEQAARQITDLQTVLYRWLDKLEGDGEWTALEVPVIHAEHSFKGFVHPFKLAAAGEDLSDSPEPFDLKIEVDGQPVRLTICKSEKQGSLVMVVRGDRHGRCAKLLSVSGQEIATIVNGAVRFEWTHEIGEILILADEKGEPVVKIKVL